VASAKSITDEVAVLNCDIAERDHNADGEPVVAPVELR
jgi:hypothetical protein